MIIAEENYQRIGSNIRPIGEAVGEGLSIKIGRGSWIKTGNTSGSIAIIDAHAGGLGLLGMSDGNSNYDNQIALIGGTSSCHMAVSENPRFIDGIWGPYYSAMIPGLWLNEGGQSATGALIDHVIFSSDHAIELKEESEKRKNNCL